MNDEIDLNGEWAQAWVCNCMLWEELSAVACTVFDFL